MDFTIFEVVYGLSLLGGGAIDVAALGVSV